MESSPSTNIMRTVMLANDMDECPLWVESGH